MEQRDDAQRMIDVDLRGKSVIVTGAASGMGACVAHAFAAAGAQVLATDRDLAGLQATRKAANPTGGPVITFAADLLEPASPRAIVEAALAAFGDLNIVISCAGVFESAPIESFAPEAFDRVLAINLRAPFFLTQAARPYLRSGDSIVIVASATAIMPSAYGTAYAASKGGLLSLVRALTAELAPAGVRVNAISPAFTETAMVAEILDAPGFRQIIQDLTPNRRIGQPDDIAQAALFLVSDSAKHVHGINLEVDGGMTKVAPSPPARNDL